MKKGIVFYCGNINSVLAQTLIRKKNELLKERDYIVICGDTAPSYKPIPSILHEIPLIELVKCGQENRRERRKQSRIKRKKY